MSDSNGHTNGHANGAARRPNPHKATLRGILHKKLGLDKIDINNADALEHSTAAAIEVVNALLDLARGGNMRAQLMIWEYTDGKPPETVVHQDGGLAPIQRLVVVEQGPTESINGCTNGNGTH
jgi:hypothetical protein